MNQSQHINPEKIQPISNQILVRVKFHNDRIIIKGGFELFLDTSYQPTRHASVHCEVVAICEHLTFGHHLTHLDSMPHKTEIEIQKGDNVIVRYLSFVTAMKHNRFFKQDDSLYFFVNYDQIYVAKRPWTKTEMDVYLKSHILTSGTNTEKYNLIFECAEFKVKQIYSVIPLNGWLLCEAEEEVINTTLIVPETAKRMDSKTCKVVFSGSCNTDYWKEEWSPDDPSVKNGSRVVVDREVMHRFLEPPEHLTFNGDKIYHTVERKNVHGLIE
jgi:hypothetical protein